MRATDPGDRTSCTSSRTSRAGARISRSARSSRAGAVAGSVAVIPARWSAVAAGIGAACRASAMWPASRAGSSSDGSRLTHPSGRSPAAAHCRSVVVLPYPAGAASTITGACPATASRRASSRLRRTRPRRSGGVFARTERSSTWLRAAVRPSDTSTRSPVPRPPAPRRVPQRPRRPLGRASTINYSTAPARGRATYFKKTLSLRSLCRTAIVAKVIRRVAVLVTLSYGP